jgi:putative tryptophan/tyrosine transport system substrate-binding protein
MRRRDFVALVGGSAIAGLTASDPAAAQQPAKVFRVGVLSAGETDATAAYDGFRNGLRDLGYVEGQTVILDFRFAKGDFQTIPALAETLIRVPVDVILAESSTIAHAAQSVTRTVPIVIALGFDPVAAGLAASAAHPGGNVTGMTIGVNELGGKRLELLKQAISGLVRVTVLLNPSTPLARPILHATEDAAKALGIEIKTLSAGSADELRALRSSAFSGSDALIVLPDSMFWGYRTTIVGIAAAAAIPAIYPERDYADDGGLMAYGANVPDAFRRAAGYVDRILRGAKPGDLPIDEAAKFDFVINLKTAHRLGLSLPPLFIARADEVIE